LPNPCLEEEEEEEEDYRNVMQLARVTVGTVKRFAESNSTLFLCLCYQWL